MTAAVRSGCLHAGLPRSALQLGGGPAREAPSTDLGAVASLETAASLAGAAPGSLARVLGRKESRSRERETGLDLFNAGGAQVDGVVDAAAFWIDAEGNRHPVKDIVGWWELAVRGATPPARARYASGSVVLVARSDGADEMRVSVGLGNLLPGAEQRRFLLAAADEVGGRY